jgi:hypothetical protein
LPQTEITAPSQRDLSATPSYLVVAQSYGQIEKTREEGRPRAVAMSPVTEFPQ